MLKECPDCGSKYIVLEQKPVYNGKSPLMTLSHKVLKSSQQSGLIRHREKGQFIFTCKSCGKSGMIYVD